MDTLTGSDLMSNERRITYKYINVGNGELLVYDNGAIKDLANIRELDNLMINGDTYSVVNITHDMLSGCIYVYIRKDGKKYKNDCLAGANGKVEAKNASLSKTLIDWCIGYYTSFINGANKHLLLCKICDDTKMDWKTANELLNAMAYIESIMLNYENFNTHQNARISNFQKCLSFAGNTQLMADQLTVGGLLDNDIIYYQRYIRNIVDIVNKNSKYITHDKG